MTYGDSTVHFSGPDVSKNYTDYHYLWHCVCVISFVIERMELFFMGKVITYTESHKIPTDTET